MAEILPFNGVRYQADRVKNIGALVCPPYDVISPEEQDRLYRSDEFNMIRVELGKETPGDGPEINKYTRAADYLRTWLDQGILQRDPRSALYLYTMDYTLPDGTPKCLKGFFSLVRLEEIGKGKIFPHEFTFPKAKQDRLELLRSCRANTSPIFMLYADPKGEIIPRLEGSVKATAPWADFTTADRIRHRLWPVSESEVLQPIGQWLRPQPLFIADGHHRYETALNFQAEMRSGNPSTSPQPYDHVLVFCSNMDDPGISLLPIHRVVMGPLSTDLPGLHRRLADRFEVSSFPFQPGNESLVRKDLLGKMAAQAASSPVFGMLAERESAYHLLRPKSPLSKGSGRMVETLDVSIFQKWVLEDTLGISNAPDKKEARVQFVKDEGAAVREVREGRAALAFFLNPTRIDQVRDVVLNGDRMPQKSTFFYPKPLTGLVLHAF